MSEQPPPPESTLRTLAVALVVAVSCSLLVSLTALGLAERHQANRDLDLLRNILAAAGVEAADALDLRIVELDTGAYVTAGDLGQAAFDQEEAIEDHTLSIDLPDDEDIARIGRRENYSSVGLVHDENDRVAQVVLPIRGRGFSSMVKAFVALAADGTTVEALIVHEQGETPGLGSEITNPVWLASWKGKKIYDDEGNVRIEVVTGGRSQHQVDAISGATVTSDGMTNLMRFWFGAQGFRVYLEKLRAEGGGHG